LRLCNWQEVFRLPLIYVSIAGLGANQFQLSIPALLFQPQAMLGQAIIPLMLVSLGYRQDPGLAASIVVLSTFMSVVTIPIVFWLIM
jgi:predicted permease